MAHSAHKTKEQIQEHFDDAKTLDQKVTKLAAMVKQSKHFTLFTGAGISTSCGIPDFRGPQGVWTMVWNSNFVTLDSWRKACNLLMVFPPLRPFPAKHTWPLYIYYKVTLANTL